MMIVVNVFGGGHGDVCNNCYGNVCDGEYCDASYGGYDKVLTVVTVIYLMVYIIR